MVSVQCQCGVQLFLGGGWVDGDSDDFGSYVFFFQVYGFFYGDFVEGVYGYFDVGEVDVGVVCFDVDFDVVVDYLFDCYKNFYGFFVIFW